MRTAKKSISAAERARDYHAGPHDSEPLDPAGKRLKAAWDLAGRVKGGNPDEIRRKIINFAREHGLMDKLPKDAQDWHAGQSDNLSRKAKGEDLRDVMRYAFNQIPDYEPDEQRRFIEVVQNRGNAHLLPDEAHGFMHMHNMPHTHDGEENELHAHTVQKAFNPVAKEFAAVKSFRAGDGEPLVIEGWLSTPDQDLEKDIVQPESFTKSMKGYFRRRAPLSYEHKTDRIPAGHLQRGAIVRDGQIITESTHPTDPHSFEHLQESMAETGTRTGVYVRGIITNEMVGKSVDQGDMGSFSYIANVTKFRYLPGGGREFLEQDPWIESTVAAYPVNQNAVITVAKAYGLVEETMPNNWESKLDELLASLNEPEQPSAPAVKALTPEELKAVLSEYKTQIVEEIKQGFESQVDVQVEKAISTQRGESSGRRANANLGPTLDDNPLQYLVQKANSVRSDGELTDQEKHLIAAVTREFLGFGLQN
jgi:hypothetical protein